MASRQFLNVEYASLTVSLRSKIFLIYRLYLSGAGKVVGVFLKYSPQILIHGIRGTKKARSGGKLSRRNSQIITSECFQKHGNTYGLPAETPPLQQGFGCTLQQLHIIIINMSRHQYEYPWSSLATPPYRPLFAAGLQSYIPYRHRAAVCRFMLVVLPLHVYVKGSTGVHHLLARRYFSNSVPHVWFVMGGRWPYRTCSILRAAFLWSCRQAFFFHTLS